MEFDGDTPLEVAPLRERKKRRTRLAIQDAAVELFAADGFEAVTVERIAQQAEVAPATVYRYFPTKEDIVVWDDHGADVAAFLARRDAHEPLIEMLGAVLTELLPNAAASDERLLARTQLVFATPAILARFRERREDVIRAFVAYIARRRGVRDDDVEVELAVRCMFEAFYVATDRWQRERGKHPLGQHAEQAFAALERFSGTASPQPRRRAR
jgi:AcrR family transcriptional regulator